jgi:HPt (histidine-containing phosphotransfer) domain-containing protein
LKGSAANLGAISLSKICEVAELAQEDKDNTKTSLLTQVLASYNQVRAELQSRVRQH